MGKKHYYSGVFAGQLIQYAFRHSKTADSFQKFLRPGKKCEDVLEIPYEDSLFWFKDPRLVDDANTEYCMSIYRTSDVLLRNKACIFHAAAVLWNNKAWLFTGDSGVGKTTQIRNLMELYGSEIRIMNGDKPILKCAENETIMVYPSPWKGKEGLGDDSLSAPLGGMIFLKQGESNSFTRIRPEDITAKTMTMVFSTFSDHKVVHNLCRMTESILNAVPCWKLTNKGDLASSRLSHDQILQEEANENDFAD